MFDNFYILYFFYISLTIAFSNTTHSCNHFFVFSVSYSHYFSPDSPLDLIQLQPLLSSIVPALPELLLPLLSLSGSLLLQLGDLDTELVQLLLPENDTGISV